MKPQTQDDAPEKQTGEQKRAQAELALLSCPIEDVEGAMDECNRERLVRERCYPRWEAEGKISRSDARDRLARIINAEKLLTLLLDTKRATA